MALPNIAQPAGNEYSPNSAALQQMGTSVNDVRKLQDQNQAIMKLLDTVSSRLGNVTNMRTNIQSGIFDAFGNNFISRGMSQITEGLSDAFDKLIHGEEEQKEDPIITELKKQNATTTAILDTSQKQLGYDEKAQLLLTDQSKVSHEILALSKHPRVNEEFAKNARKQTDILFGHANVLKAILKTLSTVGYNSGNQQKKHEWKAKEENIFDVEARVISEDRTMEKTPRQQEMDRQSGRGEGFVFGEEAETKKKSKRNKRKTVEEEIFEVPKTREGSGGPRGILLLTHMSKDIHDSKEILGKLLEYQAKSNENLTKMAHVEEEAKTEATMQQAEKEANAEVDATPRGKQTAKEGFSDFAKSFKPNFKNTLLGMMLSSSPTTTMSGAEEVTPEKDAASGPNVDLSIDASRGAPGKTPPTGQAGKAASKLARFGRFAKAVALPAAIVAGTAYTADAAFGAMGLGKDEQGNDLQVDTQQDDANWDKMSLGEKAQSGFARGIEHVGSFIGLGNMAKQAQADRIRKETEYLSGKESEASVADIEEKQKALIKTKEEPTKEIPPVSSTTMINNQTIFPTRAIVKNTDDSYNRYLNSVLA